MTRIAAALVILIASAGSTAEAQLTRVAPRYQVAPRYPVTPQVLTPRYVVPQTTTSTTQPSTQVVAPTPARPGLLRCLAEENGAYADASVIVRQDGRSVAEGSCASPLSLPPGAYTAHITLETALDRPTRAVAVRVTEGGSVTARASFQTAILEVRFTDERSPVHGLAIIRRGERVIGTLGSGVTARVSAGTYQITARYRTEDRTYTVSLAPGQRRALRAQF